MEVYLGQKARHKDLYNGKEVFEIVGIKKNEVLLEGDFSGGTHNVKQESWMPQKGLIIQNRWGAWIDMKLTAVEWLVEQHTQSNYSREVYEHAKEMEKQQMIEFAESYANYSWKISANNRYLPPKTAGGYYKEMYGDKK